MAPLHSFSTPPKPPSPPSLPLSMQGDGRCLKLLVVFAVFLLPYLNSALSLAKLNHSGELVLGHEDADADMTVTRCIEREREALLAFQQGIVVKQDSRKLFSTWGRESQKKDCCKWEGVFCDNNTGHVIQLDLGRQYLRGKMISPKLIELQHLEYLDLSYIDFNMSQIPDFIGSLTNLRHLDLSGAGFGGQISSQVVNLTHLQYLDLRDNYFTNVVNLNWLPQLSSLTYLDLSYANLSDVFYWTEIVSKLPNLQSLKLWGCGLPSPLVRSSSLSSINASKSLADISLISNHLTSSIFPWLSNHYNSLVFLHLSGNHISGSIPNVLGNMSSLTHLYLSDNQLEGWNQHSFAKLRSLESLSLSNNSLGGQISKFVQLLPACAQNSLPSVQNMSSLKDLYLDNNHLRGKLPECIGQMSKLEVMNLRMNALEGVISEFHFSRLSELSYLDLSFNSLVLNFSSDWVPPFQLDSIYLASCKLGPQFPKWLQTQKQYTYLDISDAEISDIIPSGFWDQSPNLISMNLSHNQIRGTFGNLTLEFGFIPPKLFLGSNQLEGPVPSNLSRATHLDLSNNKISGSISSLCPSVGMSSSLTFLSFSSSNVSGQLPDCLTHMESLTVLDLSNNSLSGKIPATMGSLFQIETLKLRSNSFVGELPSSLKNCTSLKVLDVGDNELSGPVPKWLGISLKNLVILMLSSNHFNESIPSQLCHLAQIQILDFSINKISGSIPKCLGNLTSLAQKGNSNLTIMHSYIYEGGHDVSYYDDATLIWKGSTQVYRNTLGLVKSIDLSSNRLTGDIPSEITNLVGLVALNLSRNHLTGQLTPDIGKLDSLDSLDLSRNRIDGRIPTTLTQIHRLGFLDLSYNNLSGKIPTGTQLQSFDRSFYAGNLQLCGPPLTKPCDSGPTLVSNEEVADELISRGFYITMVLGFVVGFWGACGSLIFIKSWRYAYFNFFNVLNDWFYVRVALIKGRFKRDA